MDILVLTPAPANISPGQRFRFEQYLQYSSNYKCNFIVKPYYSLSNWKVLHRKNHYTQKLFGVFNGLINRLLLLFLLRRYQYVYIYREAASIGPPVFEWLIAKVFRKKIIYDFDDAIWVSTASEANPKVSLIKCTWKVGYICKWSHIVTTGNYFLADYARKFCNDVRVIPTVVDTINTHNRIKGQQAHRMVIGWTGTFTNFVQLDTIIPVIRKLQEVYSFEFLVIADKDPDYCDIQYTFKKWNIKTEIDDLLNIDIGVMPLKNTILEQGKCAFKAIQYMSLGIPCVVSDVGANRDVIVDGVNGFIVKDANAWIEKLSLLLQSKELRVSLGKKARETIVSDYSSEATKDVFFSLF